MVTLPEDARLVIETAKIEDYLLNLDHEVGKSKARYFLGKGFSKENTAEFRSSLENHARTRPVISDVPSIHGRKLTVECSMSFPDGKDRCVHAVWISEPTGDFRLVTSYPKKSKRS